VSQSQEVTMSDFKLRAAVAEDVETVARLWRAGWLDAHDGHVPADLHCDRQLDDLRRRIRGMLAATTVAVDGDVVGFVTVHGDEVEQVYVAGAARGRGVADALLRHAEHRIGARHHAAWLAVVAGNTRARRFYERHGWVDGGRFDHLAPTEDGGVVVPCLRYEKDLTHLREGGRASEPVTAAAP
jgi:ribosomal protein S18 acetylase RimI-like enzyme